MDDQENKLKHQNSTANKLDLQYLITITKQFSEDQILGSGGFGTVRMMQGEKEDGEVVAVKKFRIFLGVDEIHEKQFLNEAKLLMDLCHPNIVRLEGYCYHTEGVMMPYKGSHVLVQEVNRLLCLEYLPNGSLDKYITDESSGLDWHQRYNIITGICEGLHYLHEGRRDAILHLDLKPTNVLLDKNMIPKIADFGLSRLFGKGKTDTVTLTLTGTRHSCCRAVDSADAQLKQELAAVFKKIGDKQTCTIGLYELYRITQLYPKVDIFSQLQNASEAFRTYIRDGLAQVEKNAAAGRTPSSLPLSTPPPIASIPSPKFAPSPVHTKSINSKRDSTEDDIFQVQADSDFRLQSTEQQADRYQSPGTLDALRERMKSIQAAAVGGNFDGAQPRPLASMNGNMLHAGTRLDVQQQTQSNIPPMDERALSGLQARMERLKSGSMEPL